MKTYLEFNDGKSYKFWQIETEGNSHKVTFGRIGTTGQETFKEFSSSDQALKDAEKLIESKLKKGYEKKDNSSEKKVSKHIGLTYEETEEGVSIIPKLDKLIKDPTTGSLTELIIGYWDENYSQKNSAHVVEFLATHANSFPNLKHVFIGDISQEESEISWINQCDLSPLLNAFPALESLRVRGSTDLAFSKLNHNALKTLIIESGGLPKSVIQSISNANLP
jgi:predicted DNA-binding WGR domain protein